MEKIEEKYITNLKCAAKRGEPESQFLLSCLYYDGKGVKRNYSTAVYWLTKSAGQGFAEAQCALGELFYFGRGVEKDDELAAEWFIKADKQGFADAKYHLAFCYFDGIGVEKDTHHALALLNDLANEGHKQAKKFVEKVQESGAKFALAENLYMKSKFEEAYRIFFELANNEENPTAMFFLGEIHRMESDFERAYPFYEEGYKLGCELCTWGAAMIMRSSTRSEANELCQKVIDSLLKKADDGNVIVQNMLGESYRLGLGVEENEELAFEWFKEAAEQSFAIAQYNLAFCYQFGEGVEKDISSAFDWLLKSANQGYIDAQHSLGHLFLKYDKDIPNSIYWFEKAAEAGSAEAQNILNQFEPILNEFEKAQDNIE